MDDVDAEFAAKQENVGAALETFIDEQIKICDDSLMVLLILLTGAAYYMGRNCHPRGRQELLERINSVAERAVDGGLNNRPVEH